jgi:hypothetical protein
VVNRRGWRMDAIWAWLFTPLGLLLALIALWNWDCLF